MAAENKQVGVQLSCERSSSIFMSHCCCLIVSTCTLHMMCKYFTMLNDCSYDSICDCIGGSNSLEIVISVVCFLCIQRLSFIEIQYILLIKQDLKVQQGPVV